MNQDTRFWAGVTVAAAIVAGLFAVLGVFATNDGLFMLSPSWSYYDPPGADNDHGLCKDIVSRLPTNWEGYNWQRFAMSDEDYVAIGHEGTHFLNSYLRNMTRERDNAAYVGGGRYVLFREPNVSLAEVLAFTDKDIQDNIRTVMHTWETMDDQPLYVLDEWTAYVNGCQVAIEQQREQGRYNLSAHNALRCAAIADALIAAIEHWDSGYPQLDELKRFVAWHKGRMREVLGL